MLIIIQIEKHYELMGIDFINLFKKSAYGNIYTYNLIDYFSRHIYPHLTFGTNIKNLIILFNYYLHANPKFYIIYIDASSYFTSQKLYTYF